MEKGNMSLQQQVEKNLEDKLRETINTLKTLAQTFTTQIWHKTYLYFVWTSDYCIYV